MTIVSSMINVIMEILKILADQAACHKNDKGKAYIHPRNEFTFWIKALDLRRKVRVCLDQ